MRLPARLQQLRLGHTPQKRRLICQAGGKVMLEVSDLQAKVADSDKAILTGVNLTICEGESHAIMGQNGSGEPHGVS